MCNFINISTVDRTESYARSLRVEFIENLAFGRESATSASEVHPSGAHTFRIDISKNSRQNDI